MATGQPGWDDENDLAKAKGFEYVLDPVRGGGWCMFTRGEWTVWFCGGYSRTWAIVELVDEHYVNHSYYDDLEQALDSVPPAKRQKETR